MVDLYHTFTEELLVRDNIETPSSNLTPDLYQNPYGQIYTMDKGLSYAKIRGQQIPMGKSPRPKFVETAQWPPSPTDRSPFNQLYRFNEENRYGR